LFADQADEGDLSSVRRPARGLIPIAAGRNVAQLLPSEFVKDDETVVAAIAHKSDLLSIRRPLRLGILSARISQCLGLFFPGDGSDPELLLRRPDRKFSIRRNLDVFTALFIAAHLTQQTRFAFIYVDCPYLLRALFD